LPAGPIRKPSPKDSAGTVGERSGHDDGADDRRQSPGVGDVFLVGRQVQAARRYRDEHGIQNVELRLSQHFACVEGLYIVARLRRAGSRRGQRRSEARIWVTEELGDKWNDNALHHTGPKKSPLVTVGGNQVILDRQIEEGTAAAETCCD